LQPVKQSWDGVRVSFPTPGERFTDEALACRFPGPVSLFQAVHHSKGISFQIVKHFPISFSVPARAARSAISGS
jgi:hypothetical protein